MNLKALNQNELMTQTRFAIDEENKASIKVLLYFREIERRRDFMGYASLYELAIKHFKLSEGGTQRRISSMRLIRDFPQFEEKIISGDLNITNAAMVQSYFRRAKPSRAEKIEVIKSCLNKTSRQVEKEIAKREPEADRRQDVRYSSEKRIRLSLNISEETHQVLEKLRQKYRCKNFEEVITRLAIKEAMAIEAADAVRATSAKQAVGFSAEALPPAPMAVPRQSPREPRHIPSVTKKIVLKKVQRKCCYKDPLTGEECNQTDHLEFDHIIPFSKGGPHLAENLRLLCSHHNKRLWQTHSSHSRSAISR